MSHACPDCGEACYCSGDIEDHDTEKEFQDDCVHWKQCERDTDEPYYEATGGETPDERS